MTQYAVQFSVSRLFHRQAGYPSPWCLLYQALEKVRQESLPQRLLHRYEGVSHARGGPLYKFSLLLEWLL